MKGLTVLYGSGAHRYEEQLGIVTWLMTKSRRHIRLPLRHLVDWVEPAIRHRQIEFAYDEYNKPVGFLTWALLAPDVEQRWIEDPAHPLHESEWDEGDRLWIMDLVAPFGHALEFVAYARRELFLDHMQAHSVRRNKDGAVRHRSLWIPRRASDRE